MTTNPSNQTVTLGQTPVQTATFTAAASGSPAPTVQWQVEAVGATSFNPIPGATNPTLSFTPGISDNGSQYEAVFTNTAGNVTTNPATLTVNGALFITPPGLPDGTEGTVYTQTITVLGGTKGYTFAVSGFKDEGTGLTVTPDAEAGTFTVNGASPTAGTVTFTVNVTDSAHATAFQVYTITVDPLPTPPTSPVTPPPVTPPTSPSPTPPPYVSVAVGPAGEVVELVNSSGGLTQFDAAGVHVLSTSGVRSASVAFDGPSEVLDVVYTTGGMTRFDASGAYPLSPSGVLSANVTFDGSSEVTDVTDTNGMAYQVENGRTQQLGGGDVKSVSVFIEGSTEVADVVFADGTLTQIDGTGAHVLGSGVESASVASTKSGEVLDIIFSGNSGDPVTQFDPFGEHPLGNVS